MSQPEEEDQSFFRAELTEIIDPCNKPRYLPCTFCQSCVPMALRWHPGPTNPIIHLNETEQGQW